VVLSRGPYYASVTYLAEAGATLPVEFKGWVEQEYSLL
jgi:hypothetical protein